MLQCVDRKVSEVFPELRRKGVLMTGCGLCLGSWVTHRHASSQRESFQTYNYYYFLFNTIHLELRKAERFPGVLMEILDSREAPHLG